MSKETIYKKNLEMKDKFEKYTKKIIDWILNKVSLSYIFQYHGFVRRNHTIRIIKTIFACMMHWSIKLITKIQNFNLEDNQQLYLKHSQL